MTEIYPFEEVKFQWLQLLFEDRSISTQACRIAAHIAVVYYNDDEQKAWPSHLKLSGDLAICVKTIQRNIKKLDGKWFDITISRGPGCSTIYVPTKQSHLAAHTRRLVNEEKRRKREKKRDNVVRLRKRKSRQDSLKRWTDQSSSTGPNCPPNESNELILEKDIDDLVEQLLSEAENGDWVLISGSSSFANFWDARLQVNGMPKLNEMFREDRRGFLVPKQWPAESGSLDEKAQLAAVLLAAGKNHLAERLRNAG